MTKLNCFTLDFLEAALLDLYTTLELFKDVELFEDDEIVQEVLEKYALLKKTIEHNYGK